MKIPESLDWLAGEPDGADWLSDLPHLLRDIANQWDLIVTEQPFSGGAVSYVVPVSRASDRFVLKL